MKTLTNLLATIIFIFLSLTSYAQGWQKVYAEYDNSNQGYSSKTIIPQANGNFIVLITGPGTSNNLDQYAVMEVDPSGFSLRSKTHGIGRLNNPRDMVQDDNGNLVIVNRSRNNQANYSDTYITILDNNFDIISENKIDSISPRGLVKIPGGGYWLHGTESSSNANSYIRKLDALGNQVGDPVYDGFSEFYGVKTIAAPNGGLRVTGYGKLNGNNPSLLRINEYNNAGVLINEWVFNHNGGHMYPNDISETADGGFILTARGGNNDPILLKLDQNGNETWRKVYPIQGVFLSLKNVVPTNDGMGYRISGFEIINNQAYTVLWETDINGNILWQRKYFEHIINSAGEMIALPDGGNLISGRRNANLDNNSSSNVSIPYLIRTDVQGTTISSGVNGKFSNDDDDNCTGDNLTNIPNRLVAAYKNGVVINAGQVDAQGNYHIPVSPGNYFLKPWLPNVLWETCQDSLAATVVANDTLEDLDFVLEYNVATLDSIFGYVFDDHDNDCFRDSFETIGFEGWIVHLYFSVNGQSIELTDTSDANGYYSFTDLMGLTNAGNALIYFEQPIGTGLNCNYGCWIEYELPVITGTTFQFDNGVTCDTLPFCPIMDVSIGTNRIRPCMDGSYSVNYCNIGGATAMDAYLEVTIDSALTVIDATLPWTSQMDNIYTFDLGDLLSNECGNFRINFSAPCDDPAGTTYCSEVYAYPDSTCVTPDVTWDESEIKITSSCEGDSIKFFIQNVGIGNMTSPLEYVITEDNVLLMTQPEEFQLPAGAIRTVTIPVEGDFYRMVSMQPVGFPGLATPISWVEGCGTGTATMGMTNQHPLGDEDPWYDIFCRQSVNSYDPNDKQGFPLGVDDENYIDQNEAIEYQIRFQNTGTAEAINIEIRDTLQIEFLNPQTFRPGASSHNYNWDLLGNGIVVFNFPNINLPDSTTNEAASQGFVQFKIQQNLDNPIGTEINNSAAIYFDNNDPIITNQTLHTIGEDYIGSVSVTPFENSDLVVLKIKPNPAADFIQIDLQHIENQTQLHFELYDALGNLILTQQLKNSIAQNIEIKFLAPGAYFYQLKNDEERLGYGKLIKL